MNHTSANFLESQLPLAPAGHSPSVRDKQAALIERFQIIPDPQERLSVLISRKPSVGELPSGECLEEMLVKGCQSAVYLAGVVTEGRLHLRLNAQSPMVRGLVATVCDEYDHCLLEDIKENEPLVLEALGLHRILSGTRQAGLAAVRGRIVKLASSEVV